MQVMQVMQAPVGKEEQDLREMIEVLRVFFANAATNAQWQRHMQTYAGAGWSRASFSRRLKVLKARNWVRIVGGDGKSPVRVNQGEFYEATTLNEASTFGDLRPVSSVSKQSHDADETTSSANGNGSGPVTSEDLDGAVSELAKAKKAAQEQFERRFKT